MVLFAVGICVFAFTAFVAFCIGRSTEERAASLQLLALIAIMLLIAWSAAVLFQ